MQLLAVFAGAILWAAAITGTSVLFTSVVAAVLTLSRCHLRGCFFIHGSSVTSKYFKYTRATFGMLEKNKESALPEGKGGLLMMQTT